MDVAADGQKRTPKPTAKAVEEKLNRLKGERKGKLSQITRKANHIQALKENRANVEIIKEEALFIFGKFYGQFKEINAALMPLLEEEDSKEDQEKWFMPKCVDIENFVKETEDWIDRMENYPEEEKNDDDNECDDDVKPSDSISEVIGHASKGRKDGSVASRSSQVSTTSSARLKLEAEREELRAQAAFLNKKQDIEMEEVRLKARKEQLDLDAKIAASNAKIKVYTNYEDGQDGMNEYYESERRHKASRRVTCQVKDEDEESRTQVSYTTPMVALRTSQPANVHARASAYGADSSAAPVNHVQQAVTSDGICKIMQRQNEITELLVRHQRTSQLPRRDVPIFYGDPLSYHSFITAFEQTVERKTASQQDRLLYLQQYTSGEPRDLVLSCEHMKPDEGYEEARRLLQQHYGDELRIATAYMKKALQWPQIKTEDRKALHSYALFLTGCRNTMSNVEYMAEMDNPSNMKTVISKLPFKLKERWRNQAYEIHTSQGRRAKFSDIVDFINWQAEVINDPLFGDILDLTIEEKGKTKVNIKRSNPKSSFATTVSPAGGQSGAQQSHQKEHGPAKSADAFQSPCMYCKKRHTLEVCEKIKEQTPKERIRFLATKGLCFGCLTQGHLSKSCRKRMQCSECSGKHPSILHVTRDAPALQERDENRNTEVTGEVTSAFVEAEHENRGHTGAGNKETILPIVPVKIKSKRSDKVMQVYAFLDQGSTATFCTDDVMQQLNLRGRKSELLLTTMGSEKKVNTHVLSELEVCGLEEENYIHLPQVFTQPSIPVKKENIPLQRDVDQWPYLHGVRLLHIEAEVGLLIGTDVYKAMEPRQIINSRGDGPYAVKTSLGWVINGPLRGTAAANQDVVSHSVNRISVSNVENLLTQLYNADFPERGYDDKSEMSQEDHQFLDSVKESTQLVDGHYCIGLPLKDKEIKMPDNRSLAEQRRTSLKRKFQRNPDFYQEYNRFMTELVNKGYAIKVPEEELQCEDGRLWFIPHHGVYHPKKKKLRVVFDCTASYQGVSLNNRLLQGPDLTNTLVGVLTRFRKDTVGMMADIDSMFYQVKVPKEDSDLLRFLWWPDGDLSSEAADYRMCVHLFGAASSPSCASYALRRTAEDGKTWASPEAVETILNNFYVDDCLSSVSSDEHAVALAKDLRTLCLSGGFHLSKWTSNSRALLMSIPEEDRASGIKDLDLDNDQLPTERALGVHWCTNSDMFKLKIEVQQKPCTRRGILSVVGSAFDPLGFLAPFVLPAKLLLRELCKEKKAWDDTVSEEQAKKWKKWLSDLEKLSSFCVSRCIKPAGFGVIKTAQLHHFSDASNDGYGTVSYLLLTNEKDQKLTSFMIGKSRVAPLKLITIPRMELTAAVIAVKMDKMLQCELQLQLSESRFWTDSVTVLKYIENDAARYKTFVANRVSFIKEATKPSQWKYVSTADNPADQASTGLSAESLLQSKNWIQGPEFLLRSEDEWPKRPDQPIFLEEEDAEVKRSAQVSLVQTDEKLDVMSQFVRHFSSWYKLKKATAWLIRLKEILLNMKQKRKELQETIQKHENDTFKAESLLQQEMLKYKQSSGKQVLTTEDLAMAETELIRLCQRRKYAEELKALLDGKDHVRKDSHIFKLDPYLKDGVLRVGGRLGRSAMPLDAKHPAILHKDDWIAKLILRHIHEATGHSGRNYILARLRQKFWIPKACSAIQRMISECNTCRRLHAKAGEQKMANLPEDRLLPDKPPFTNTGVDFFGPFEVSRGRSKVKRYGVLFTCLTSRAVHIEVAHSLDTSSCINALRRFLSRRGQVSVLRSDNGTNFVGAERELKESLKDLDQPKIQESMLRRGVKWIFNTPAASHHGGVWERQIRTVRKVLSSLLKQQLLDDEGLQTLLCEVESIINDRPITTTSNDPNDLEALTPNHLLVMRTQPNIPPGVFSKDDLYARRRWRQIQYMADLFWRRWTQEYLPLLQERQKWSTTRRNFSLGDVVLIVDSSAPRNSWLIGKIVKIMPDSKGTVRSVCVQTKTSTLERPITKICLLEEAS